MSVLSFLPQLMLRSRVLVIGSKGVEDIFAKSPFSRSSRLPMPQVVPKWVPGGQLPDGFWIGQTQSSEPVRLTLNNSLGRVMDQ